MNIAQNVLASCFTISPKSTAFRYHCYYFRFSCPVPKLLLHLHFRHHSWFSRPSPIILQLLLKTGLERSGPESPRWSCLLTRWRSVVSRQPSAIGSFRGCLSGLSRSPLSQGSSRLVSERSGVIKNPPRPFQPKVGQLCAHRPQRSQRGSLRLWAESPFMYVEKMEKDWRPFYIDCVCAHVCVCLD